MSDSSGPHELQHARLPCPSPPPWACSKSCPWSQWCQPTTSVVPFSCPQSFPAWESFPVSWLFASGGQNIGASASASVLPMNIQGWFSLGLTGLISLLSNGHSRVFSSTQLESINSLALSLLYGPTLTSIHDYWKNRNLNYVNLCQFLITLDFCPYKHDLFILHGWYSQNSWPVRWLKTQSCIHKTGLGGKSGGECLLSARVGQPGNKLNSNSSQESPFS